MRATITWNEKLKFTGVADSGFAVTMDTKKESGGEDSAVRPTELLAMSVGGCTAMDVISILQKKRQDITGLEIVVHADRAMDHPRKFLAMTIEYIVTGRNVDPEAVERAVQLSEDKYCSVINTLKGNVEFKRKIVIKEPEAV
ncbi:MAG TPA: OsmC family protein [Bellilinea sp.]|nr:OsmC family protein [Bellilinea sp.]